MRTFGMCGWASVENCVGFDEAMDALDEYRVIEVEKSATGQRIVTFLHGPKNDMKTSLWIDEQKGFTIGRGEFRGLHLATGEWTDVVSSTEIDWDERSGVFVPKRLVLERHFNGHESYSLALEWSAVNEPVDERLFEIEGMNLTAGTPIFDQRRGEKPVVLGRVRDTSDLPRDPAPAADRPPPTRSWLVATNFALVAIIVAALWFVRRRRRRNS